MAKKWVQKADKAIERKGTEGALTRQAKARGWKTALPFARAVVKAWDRAKKTGKTPTVLNKKTGRQSEIDTQLWRRANFAVNVQPKKGNPHPAYSVRCQETDGRWKAHSSAKSLDAAKKKARSLYREGYYAAVFDGRKKVYEAK